MMLYLILNQFSAAAADKATLLSDFCDGLKKNLVV